MIDSMVVAYSSKEQKSIALSSCESELFALSQSIRLVGYMRQVLQELHVVEPEHH